LLKEAALSNGSCFFVGKNKKKETPGFKFKKNYSLLSFEHPGGLSRLALIIPGLKATGLMRSSYLSIWNYFFNLVP
jgi:hypothetical protein